MPVFPTEFIDSERISIESRTETVYSKYGMNIQVAKYGDPHQWVIDMTLPPLDPRTGRRLNAFLNSLGGRYGITQMFDPTPLLGDGLSDLNATGLKGDSEVTISTTRTGETPILAGCFFKFANHDKVYQCTEDYVIGSNLKFYPSLRFDVSNVAIESAIFTLRLTSDVNTLSWDAKQYNLIQSIEFEENV